MKKNLDNLVDDEAEAPLECLELCALDYADYVTGARDFTIESDEYEAEGEASTWSISDAIFENAAKIENPFERSKAHVLSYKILLTKEKKSKHNQMRHRRNRQNHLKASRTPLRIGSPRPAHRADSRSAYAVACVEEQGRLRKAATETLEKA